MRASFLVLTILLALISAKGTHAQEAEMGPSAIRFERAVEVEANLPQSSVYEMLEDRRGFLWFATREGLGRWDGYTMRIWRRDPFDPASLPGNVVRELVEDGAGNLWANTQQTDRTSTGIARLVGPSHETVRRYGHADARLLLGPEATVWLVDTDSLFCYDAERDRFVALRTRISDAFVAMQGGMSTADGTLWISTRDGLEAYPPGQDGTPATGRAFLVGPDVSWGTLADPAYSPFSTLAEDEDGTLWIGGARLARLDSSRRRMETLPTPTPDTFGSGAGLTISEIIPGGENLWLGTLDGVYRYNIADGAFERHSLRLAGDIATQNWVTALHRDRTGALWAGTVWGLHRALPLAAPFQLLAHDPDDSNSLGSGIVMAIQEDVHGALWVGTLGGGLNRIDPDGRVTRYRHDAANSATVSHDWIWSLASDGKTLWVGTGSGLDAIRLDQPNPVERLHFGLDATAGWGPSANGLHLDAEGTLWFGHLGGLNRLLTNGALLRTRTPGRAGITAIRTIPGGAWVATTDGLLRYDAAEDAFHSYRHDPNDPASLSDDAIITLHLDRTGALWVGTQSGLNRTASDAASFTHFTSANGLPSDVVYSILEDDGGDLWVSTNRGLARLSLAAPERGFRAFTFTDGVGNVEFNTNAAFRAADGMLYFGGDRGVTVFHPSALRANPYRAPIVLTALHRSTREGTETTRFVEGPIEISPDQYTFSLEFAALNFSNAAQLRYAVQMDGWDKDWVQLGTQRQATYTNLPPGHYTFRVRASNEDGLWNEEGIAVPIIVRPRLWQTWWFRAFLVLAAVAFVAFVVWTISRRRYERKLARLEAHRALDAERSRISRDMHDEVGASLSEIAILSELARRELDRPAAADDRLERIAEGSRAMLDSLGQIVWAINPKNDRLPALAGYLREHAARYLDAAELPATLNFPAFVANASVTAEVRRNVFLILKEALHNIVKHASANHVTVTLSVKDVRLTLVVEDDGLGFAQAGGDGAPLRTADGFHGGNGLGNMHRRAREISGVLVVDTMLNRGTTLQLTAPLSAPPAVSSQRLTVPK